jgi:hypothetical protein
MRELLRGMERVLKSEESAVLGFNAQVEWISIQRRRIQLVLLGLKLIVNSDVGFGNCLITLSTGST